MDPYPTYMYMYMYKYVDETGKLINDTNAW